jgi:predicted AlkP superfamily phosphohydrolase/phosphomutase
VTARVLFVSWESAERELIDRWVSDGRLPTLAALRANGVRVDVESPVGFGDDAAWTSFATGADLGEHGRCYWQTVAPNGRTLRFWERATTALPAFWDELVARGRRVAVIDVPSITGSDPRALVVSDWTGHAVERREPSISPPGAVTGIARDPAWDCDELGRDADATRTFSRLLCDRAAQRESVELDLLAGDSWDLFVTVASEAHCVGHQCWHDHDPAPVAPVAPVAHDVERSGGCGDPVEAVYRDADARLARLVDAAGPDAIVVVFSLLGMGPNHSGEHLLDEVLVRLDGADGRPSPRLRAVRTLKRLTPARARRRAPARVREVHRNAIKAERARRSAWLLPTDLPTSAVRIGVAGRDDDGIVEPDARAERCAQLVDALLALEDPETARRIVDEVVDVRAVHGARVADEFADLLVVWSRDQPITGACSPAVGVVRGAPPPARSGNHRTDGWAVVSGARETGWERAALRADEFAGLVSALLGTTDPNVQLS